MVILIGIAIGSSFDTTIVPLGSTVIGDLIDTAIGPIMGTNIGLIINGTTTNGGLQLIPPLL